MFTNNDIVDIEKSNRICLPACDGNKFSRLF